MVCLDFNQRIFTERVVVQRIESALEFEIGLEGKEIKELSDDYDVSHFANMGLSHDRIWKLFELEFLNYAKIWKEYNQMNWNAKPQKREDVLRERYGTIEE